MAHDAYNELTAAYALDALDPTEARAYEEHLAGCTSCQDDLAALSATAVALAYAAPPVDPPEPLRGRILDSVRAEREHERGASPARAERQDEVARAERDAGDATDERSNVVPFRRRWSRPSTALAAVAAVAACLVIGLGIWNVSLNNRLDRAQQALQTVPLDGAAGSVVVGAGGHGVLVLSNVASAPEGKTYEAWVIHNGAAKPAGVFDGGGTVAVSLEQPVPSGAIVAVTVEPTGGVEQPTSDPIITSATV
jgi:anti-sigma-K factor RskA